MPLARMAPTAPAPPPGCVTRSLAQISIPPKPASRVTRSLSSSVPESVTVSTAKWSSCMPRRRLRELRHGAELFRGDLAEAEEFEIQRDLLEQHVGADLDRTAALAGGVQQGRDLLLH